MPENCPHDCSTCGESCSERDLRVPANALSSIKKVIAVVSGKGGVGKSTVTSSLAVAMARRGRKVAVLDADITGPSIPMAFGVHQRATGTDAGIDPAVTPSGIKLMSLNLLTANETDPVIWRGPVIGGVVTQFWTDVLWDVDYLLVDMPPGTGDVTLSVFQSIPLSGIVVVASPQELVGMVVEKAVKMAEKMAVPIVGLVENMSGLFCPHCGEEIDLFKKGGGEALAKQEGLNFLGAIPLDPATVVAADRGHPIVSMPADTPAKAAFLKLAETVREATQA